MTIETVEELEQKSLYVLIAGIVSLVLAVISFIMCNILGPFALGLGAYSAYAGFKCTQAAKELESSDPKGLIGMILGIIGAAIGMVTTLLLLLVLLFLVVYIVGILVFVVMAA